MNKNDPSTEKLARILGFWSLTIYGIGDILGAGIYALLGKVVDIGKGDSWMAFTFAFLVALLTACSYAELGSRYPKSSGAALFCLAAFKIPALSLLLGWMVLWSGMVSMATISQAFGMQFIAWIPVLPLSIMVVSFLGVLSFINFWGIRYTSFANVLCTAIELSGLLIVIYASFNFLSTTADRPPITHSEDWSSVFLASGIAFFALIGFEDMVNVAEEVKRPERTLPRAILSAIFFAGIMYIAIAYLVVQVIPSDQLGASSTPLLDVVERGLPVFPLSLFALIALFAMANTALLNFVMGSRLLYGMSQEGLLPAFLGKVHSKRKTPYLAIISIFCIVAPMAIVFDLIHLAATTSALLLGVFSIVHLSLITIKVKKTPHQGFSIPMAIPVLGIFSIIFLLFHLPLESLLGTFVIIFVGAIGIYYFGKK